MKKLSLLLVFMVFAASPVFSKGKDKDKNRECYDRVRADLLLSAQFGHVLPDLNVRPSTPQAVTIDTCKDKGHSFGALDPNVKDGDPVWTRHIDATVTLTIQPVIQGAPLGGTTETVTVNGSLGYLFNVEDSDQLDVDDFTYRKDSLR